MPGWQLSLLRRLMVRLSKDIVVIACPSGGAFFHFRGRIDGHGHQRDS